MVCCLMVTASPEATTQRNGQGSLCTCRHNRAAVIIPNSNDMEEIMQRLDAIEQNSLLAAKNVLTIDDVAKLTGMSKSHLYKLTCSRQKPHYKPNSKSLYFDRKEIEDWMKQNRVKTTAEAEQEAIAHVVKGGKK